MRSLVLPSFLVPTGGESAGTSFSYSCRKLARAIYLPFACFMVGRSENHSRLRSESLIRCMSDRRQSTDLQIFNNTSTQRRLLLPNQPNNAYAIHHPNTHPPPSLLPIQPPPNRLRRMSNRPNQHLHHLPTTNLTNNHLPQNLPPKLVDLPLQNRALDRLSRPLSRTTTPLRRSLYVLFFR